MAAAERNFHPVREWFARLQWDGERRVDGWLTHCLGVEDSEYSMLAGRFFMLHLVARIRGPGCICRSVLGLEGEQKPGKSEAPRALSRALFAPPPLAPYTTG